MQIIPRRPSRRLLTGAFLSTMFLAACSSGATTAPSVAPSIAPSAAAASAAAGGATVLAKALSSGTELVAGSNGMTVYTFSKDVAGSPSACTGGCITKWPALTVPAGSTPTAGDGVTGALATITRPDDGTLQVTYKGLPLYFFSGDKAPGDTNGSYTGWSLVTP